MLPMEAGSAALAALAALAAPGDLAGAESRAAAPRSRATAKREAPRGRWLAMASVAALLVSLGQRYADRPLAPVRAAE